MIPKNKKTESEFKSFLPKDAAEFLKRNKCENDYLSLHRLGEYEITEKSDKKVKPLLNLSREPSNSNDMSKSYMKEILQSLSKRQERIAGQLPGYMKLRFNVKDRLLLGVGGSKPFTTINGMTLHPVYGIPYIPGSALKGVVRHCWIHEHLEGDSETSSDTLQKTFFNTCFGTGTDDEQAASGQLIFMDAYPIGSYTIVEDVQTPHYKTYYNSKGSTPPRDDDSPNIISFAAIENTAFDIYLGIWLDEIEDSQREMIKDTVICALSEYGIGAKTAIGYGLGELSLCEG